VLAWAVIGAVRAEEQSAPLPFSGIEGKAMVDCRSGALAVAATAEGARLRCGFQKLEGRAGVEGLWLESTGPGGGNLRLVAEAVGREAGGSKTGECRMRQDGGQRAGGKMGRDREGQTAAVSAKPPYLACGGRVSVEDKLVRYIRPGLTDQVASLTVLAYAWWVYTP
jgi:hypothetical protein